MRQIASRSPTFSIHSFCTIKRFLTTSSSVAPSKVVDDEQIAKLASEPLHPLTLADLVKNGRPPLPASALYQSANFALSVLPTRLAHRIKSLRSLPFIVVTNPNVCKIHNNYVHSLSTLLPFAERQIDSPEIEDQFTEALAGLVQTHANTIPVLARGFLESKKYISPAAVTQFLDEHLRARIGTRLVAEQHIALHYSSQPYQKQNQQINLNSDTRGSSQGHSSYIGIIDTELRPATVVRACQSFVSEICELRYGVRPIVEIDGEPDATIAFVPVHLEYILTELLKNAFRATVEHGHEKDPIQVTIAPAPAETMAPTDGISPQSQGEPQAADPINIKPLQKGTPGVTIRIRDQGGGISPANYANIWNYSFTTFSEDENTGSQVSPGAPSDAFEVLANASAGGSTIAGLGYGLPLSRAYAEYFGGGVAVQSLWGWGTDVYLSLRGVGGIA